MQQIQRHVWAYWSIGPAKWAESSASMLQSKNATPWECGISNLSAKLRQRHQDRGRNPKVLNFSRIRVLIGQSEQSRTRKTSRKRRSTERDDKNDYCEEHWDRTQWKFPVRAHMTITEAIQRESFTVKGRERGDWNFCFFSPGRTPTVLPNWRASNAWAGNREPNYILRTVDQFTLTD